MAKFKKEHIQGIQEFNQHFPLIAEGEFYIYHYNIYPVPRFDENISMHEKNLRIFDELTQDYYENNSMMLNDSKLEEKDLYYKGAL